MKETYPNFCELLKELKVDSQPAPMSISVRCEQSNLEYRGMGINGLFAQRRNVFNVSFLKMMFDWHRFNKKANSFLASDDQETTVGEFFQAEKLRIIF